MAVQKLFLLDAYALIYRSYYAFIKNPRINSKGINTSAVFGFTLTLEEVIRKEQPSHLAVVFDPPGPGFRNEIYEAYKAQRPPMPEELRQSIPYIRKLIEAFNIEQIEVPRYEADDVIGTLAVQAEQQGFEVFMMTPDKDFSQLVTDQIKIFKPRRTGTGVEILGRQEICEKYNLKSPAQFIDILALWGDTADNIPGAPGIGEKTAKSLIERYDSVEGIYAHINELRGKQKENLLHYKEQVELAHDLVTIRTDAPVQFDANQLKYKGFDDRAIKELFDELEFRTLHSRLFPQTAPTLFHSDTQSSSATQTSLFSAAETAAESTGESSLHTPDHTKHRYHLINRETQLNEVIELLAKHKEFCLDTETTGLDALEVELVGLALSWKKSEAWYILFPDDRKLTLKWLERLKPVLERPGTVKIGQNLKYDLQILANYNIHVAPPLFDTMVAHYLLKPDESHNLNHLVKVYLDHQMIPIEQLIGEKGKAQGTMRSVAAEQQAEYAGEDADYTFQLKPLLEKELKEAGLVYLFEKIENPLIPVLADMERKGIRLDPDSLTRFSEELEHDIQTLEQEILDLAGISFNVASPKQLGTVLFDHLKIDPGARKKTKSKQYSTSEEVLTRLKSKHPIISKVLEFRGLKKLQNTYVKVLPTLIKPSTGKIHTHFNQTITATGRLSSINPNLQNIPIRETRGRAIRKAFVPSDDQHVILSADYSQIELRIMAHLSGDENMIAAFNRDEDIHAMTASLIYGVSLNQVTREMRGHAKTANFGIIYGISAFGLAQRLNIRRGEAQSLIDGYFKSYPGVKKYMDFSIQNARDKGYVTTLMGRKRYLRDIHSQNPVVRGNAERNAINSPVQGSAADIIKLAMIRIHNRFQQNGLRSAMVLQVHDELDFDVCKPELDQVKEIVRHEMEHAYQLKIKMVVDIGVGNNWLEAHG